MDNSQIKELLGERVKWQKPGKGLPAEPPQITVVHHPEPCEDCGITVTDRRIEHRHRESPVKHWTQRCLSCKLMKHPKTGEFEVTPSEYIAIYNAFLEEKTK